MCTLETITLEKLDPIKHQKLKILPHQFMGDKNKVHLIDVFPAEITAIAQELPLFFSKDHTTGQFNLITLMGLAIDENLMIKNNQWQGRYLPLKFQAQPFYLLPTALDQENHSNSAMNIAIDVADKHVQEANGEPLFIDNSPSEYLTKCINKLAQITQGYAELDQLTKFYLEHSLIEPVTLDITLKDKQTLSLTGLYTIKQAELADFIDKNYDPTIELSDHTSTTRTAIYLKMAQLIVNSQQHVKQLIALKDQQPN